MHKRFTFAVVLFATSMTLLNGQQPKKPSIARLDPALDAIVPAGSQVEVLKDGFKDGLEGGVWDRKGGYLLFSNKPERLINKWTPDGKLSVYLNLAEVAHIADAKASLSSGTTMDREGRLVYCSPGERTIVRIEPDGKRSIVADRYQSKRLSHPNDLEHPNGIAVSPDEKFLYINDSAKQQVWRFDIQPDDSAINGRVWLDMSSDKTPGIPDGMRVDKKGNVYDAGPGGIWIVSPEGKHIGTLLIPAPDRPTNLAFGDSDGKTLYLTNHMSLYRVRLNIEGVRP